MSDALVLPTPANISGLILAGGQALRMGGIAKGLAPLDNRPLLAHVIERLMPQVSTLRMNANRADYAVFGLPVIADRMPGFVGPLAGLHAGLIDSPTPWLATVPCDAPHLPHDLVARLAAAARTRRQCRAFVAAGPHGIEPGFMLIHTTLAHDLGEWLENGGRKVRDWLATATACEVPFPDAAAFANVNTAEELARLEAAYIPGA